MTAVLGQWRSFGMEKGRRQQHHDPRSQNTRLWIGIMYFFVKYKIAHFVVFNHSIC
jgi:hypothetical protein